MPSEVPSYVSYHHPTGEQTDACAHPHQGLRHAEAEQHLGGERAQITDLEQPGHPSVHGEPVRHPQLKLTATISDAVFQPVQVPGAFEKAYTGDEYPQVSQNTQQRGLRHEQHEEGAQGNGNHPEPGMNTDLAGFITQRILVVQGDAQEGDTKRGEPQPVPARLQKAGERCHVVSNAIFDESP